MRSTSGDHRYGPNVCLLSEPTLVSLLAKLCSPDVYQPQINSIIERLYARLAAYAIDQEFPLQRLRIATRMTATHPNSPLELDALDQEQRAVVVNLARAGTYPSHICYSLLNECLNPRVVRQDHILASRAVDANEKVTGTAIGGAKIGGDVEGAIVLFPDPMGATGNTICSALAHYKNVVGGAAKRYVALHLIVTPEYLRRTLRDHPDLHIIALRVDRGLSEPTVLKAVPGEYWDLERGLDDKHYIVPGGGGFGEVMNNSFV